MIARCDRCDAKRAHATGYRWDPEKAGLGLFKCPECRGRLRAKRKGETEANIIDARMMTIDQTRP